MKKSEVVKFLSIITAFFPDRRITDEMITGWHIMLEDMPYELAEQALKAVLSKNRFFPSIAEIREEAAAIARPMPTAAEAWEEVNKERQRVGWSFIKKPEFSDELIERTVEAFGWDGLCASENIDVARGQFLKLYRELAKQKRERVQIPESVQTLIQKTKIAQFEQYKQKKLPKVQDG